MMKAEWIGTELQEEGLNFRCDLLSETRLTAKSVRDFVRYHLQADAYVDTDSSVYAHGAFRTTMIITIDGQHVGHVIFAEDATVARLVYHEHLLTMGYLYRGFAPAHKLVAEEAVA